MAKLNLERLMIFIFVNNLGLIYLKKYAIFHSFQNNQNQGFFLATAQMDESG